MYTWFTIYSFRFTCTCMTHYICAFVIAVLKVGQSTHSVNWLVCNIWYTCTPDVHPSGLMHYTLQQSDTMYKDNKNILITHIYTNDNISVYVLSGGRGGGRVCRCRFIRHFHLPLVSLTNVFLLCVLLLYWLMLLFYMLCVITSSHLANSKVLVADM